MKENVKSRVGVTMVAFTEKQAQEYFHSNNLVDLMEKRLSDEIEPKLSDLAMLHKIVRDRKPYQILEFGSGFSTVVMAHALKQNWNDYLALRSINAGGGNLDYPQPKVTSLESAKKWRKNTMIKVNAAGLSDFSEISISTITITEHQGQICHVYDNLPDIVPDFVYLDGPDPQTVQGSVNGLTFKNPKRTVMSADILKYESTILPGFYMMVEGRSNNARFLQRMLTRDYEIKRYEDANVTTFELKEPRLGRKNIYGWEAYNHKKVP